MPSLPPAAGTITGIYLPPGFVCLSSLPNSPQHPSIQGTRSFMLSSQCAEDTKTIPDSGSQDGDEIWDGDAMVQSLFCGKNANTIFRRYCGLVASGKSQTRR